MASFACDNNAVESLLRKLANQVIALGGRLSADAEIGCEDGNLSIRSRTANGAKGELVAVPEAALIPVSQASFTLQGDDIVARPVDGEMDRNRRSLLQLMTEIYNLTGKIKSFRATSPRLCLAHSPEVLAHLLAGRHIPDKPPQPDEDDQVVRLFIKSRTLGYSFDGAPKTPVLMPLIDSLNHHHSGANFRPVKEKGETGLAVNVSRPIAGSTECFARYGLYDAHDTYLNYAYVEPNTPFLLSVSCDLGVPDLGRITVRSASGVIYDGPLAKEIRDLRAFMPRVTPEAPDHIRVSHLIVPWPARKFALRRVLAEIIKLFDLAQNKDMLVRRVALAERDLLTQNIAYYRDLDRFLKLGAQNAALAAPRQLATIQHARIQAYIDTINTPNGG